MKFFLTVCGFFLTMLIAAAAASPVDEISFGDSASERAHGLTGESTSVIRGGLGEAARVANATGAPAGRAGDLSFSMAVDPAERNYFSIKFWGEDTAGLAVVDIGGRQIGYRSKGDYEPINSENGKALPGRFYYGTILLPLDATRGRDKVDLTLRTYLEKDDDVSRSYYKAYTHTAACLDVSGEKQGEKPKAASFLAPDRPQAEKDALMKRYRREQIEDFEKFSKNLDGDKSAKLSIERYKDELRYYASSIGQPWSPAKSQAEKRKAIDRVFQTIDNHVRGHYGNIRLVTRGGHQGDWGGYYGALGEALYIIEPLLANHAGFKDFLDEPFETGTTVGEFSLAEADWGGGGLTRREAWERVLKANFDFARSRLSYIYNQMMYTYEGAWEAHEGLRIIGSGFYEGKERSHRILREALGIAPFLGEEILVSADDRDLDLYHSLFHHDGGAVFTADTLQVVAKGLAKSKLDADGKVMRRRPYGDHYLGITEAGLARENGYVGNYGETPNYLPEHFYRTLGHPGDEALNDDILKLALRNIHARSYTRYTDLDEKGHRIMRMQQVLDERNPAYPGMPAYATRTSTGKAFLFASLAKYMLENPARYEGPGWAEYRRYGAEAIAFARQQLADNQVFSNPSAVSGMMGSKKADFLLPETYDYLTNANRHEGKGIVHPLTDFHYYTSSELAGLGVAPSDYNRIAWTDIDNMMVVLRDGPVQISGIFNFRNRGFTNSGRVHVVMPNYEHLAQIETRARFQYRDYHLRMNDYYFDFMVGNRSGDGPRPQALAGEICPITWQPGIGKVVRENYSVDHPYSGMPDFLQSRYGPYFFVFNTTRPEHGNTRSFEAEVPADHRSATVFDLVSGREIPLSGGKFTIAPKTVMVLKLESSRAAPTPPDGVNFLAVLPGNLAAMLTWKNSAGAASYTISRATTEAGPYESIASGVNADHYTDKTVAPGQKFHYQVQAVNAAGAAGWNSQSELLELSRSALPAPWRDDRIGTTQGVATADGGTLSITGGNGTGLGAGDDYKIDSREIRDSLHFISQPASGSFSLQAKLEAMDGKSAGLLLRDKQGSDARYFYFGADQDGRLFIQNRTRDARHEVSGKVISPMRVDFADFTLASHPWIRLVRDSATHEIRAFASKNGREWEDAGMLFTPFPAAVHAVVSATGQARFTTVEILNSGVDSR